MHRGRWSLVVGLAVLLLVIGAAACGSDDDDDGGGGAAQTTAGTDGADGGVDGDGGSSGQQTEPTPAERKQQERDETQILRVGSDLYAKIAGRNAKAVCAALTEAGRAQVAESEGKSCVAYYEDLLNPLDKKGRDRFAASAEVSAVDLKGDKATTLVTFKRSGGAGVLELEREDGGWKVKAFTIPRSIAIQRTEGEP